MGFLCRSPEWQQFNRKEKEKMGLIVRDVGEFWYCKLHYNIEMLLGKNYSVYKLHNSVKKTNLCHIFIEFFSQDGV